MNDVMTLLPWFLLGLALGAGYLYLLRLSVRALTEGGGRLGAVWPYALRIGAAALAFYTAAQSGALAMVLVLAGFLLARSTVLRLAREG